MEFDLKTLATRIGAIAVAVYGIEKLKIDEMLHKPEIMQQYLLQRNHF